jgi:hypothetical protein
VGAALRSVYQTILTEGSTDAYQGELYDFTDFAKLMGFQEVWDFDKKHAD